MEVKLSVAACWPVFEFGPGLAGLCAKSAHPRISPVSLYFNSQTIYGGSHISPWSHQSYLVYTKDDVRRARAGLAERVGCMQRRVAADSQQQPFVKARKR